MAIIQLPNLLESKRNWLSLPSRRRRRENRISAKSGVFFRQESPEQFLRNSDATEDAKTVTSDTTTSCPSSPGASQTSLVSWKSTTRESFFSNQPLVVSDPDASHEIHIADPVVALKQVMARSKDLPGTWYYSSNHVMVNNERRNRMVAPLRRLEELDALARAHAQAMADANRLHHADPQHLCTTFARLTRMMGENVAVGDSIREMHAQMMQNRTHQMNILHRGYTHFGMGTAKGADGRLYLCQLFRG